MRPSVLNNKIVIKFQVIRIAKRLFVKVPTCRLTCNNGLSGALAYSKYFRSSGNLCDLVKIEM